MQENDIEKNSNRQILRGSFLAYLSLAVNIISGIVYTPWMIRQIGQSNYGLYTIAVSLISMFMFDFGIGSVVNRFVAQYRTQNDMDSLQKIVGLIYKLFLIIAAAILVIAAVFFFLMGGIYKNLAPDEIVTLRIIYVIVMVYNLIAFIFQPLEGILSAYEQFTVLKVCDLSIRLITIVLVAFSLWLGLGIYSLVIANVTGGLLVIGIKWFVVHKKMGIHVQWRGWDKPMLLSVFSLSIWSSLMGLAPRLSVSAMPSIVAVNGGTVSTAIYGAAVNLDGYAYLLVNAFSGLFLSKVTRILHRDEAQANLNRLAIRVGRILMMLSCLILSGFFLIGKEFYCVWMGPEYIASYPSACALLIAELMFTPLCIYTTAMMSKGYLKPMSIAQMATSLLAFGMATILAKVYGPFGCALSMCLTSILFGVIRLYLQYRYLHVDVWEFLKYVYAAAIPYLAMGLVLNILLKGFTAESWMGLFIKGIMIVLSFAVVTFLFVTNGEEKGLLKGFVKKIVGRMHLGV